MSEPEKQTELQQAETKLKELIGKTKDIDLINAWAIYGICLTKELDKIKKLI